MLLYKYLPPYDELDWLVGWLKIQILPLVSLYSFVHHRAIPLSVKLFKKNIHKIQEKNLI